VGLIVAGVAVVLVVALANGDDGTTAAEDETPVIDAGSVSPGDLRPGDCFNGMADLGGDLSEVLGVEQVDCEQPHDNEAFDTFMLTGDNYPGEDLVMAQAFEGCVDRFESFVGVPYEDAALELPMLFPFEEDWRMGARGVLCIVANARGGTLTGSAEGLGGDDEFIHLTRLQVGDCFDRPEQGVVDGVERVACSQPHDAEVYFADDLTGDRYPGDTTIDEESADRCVDRFEAFVGVSYQASRLEWGAVMPNQTTWEAGSRHVACYVFDPDGKLTGTVEGTGQ
jgi:hypothetical protein